MKLVLKYCGMNNDFSTNYLSKTKSMTPLAIPNLVWAFWHENSQESTITSQIAKIHVNSKPQRQEGSEFLATVTTVTQRKRDFFQSLWKTVNETYRVLYQKYCTENPSHIVLYGIFIGLKSFYVCSPSSRDLEMCCCKLHLHGRWITAALIECAKKQFIVLPFSDYTSFFDHLSQSCPKDPHTYISWHCTPDKKNM